MEQKTIDSDGANKIPFADVGESKLRDLTFFSDAEIAWAHQKTNRADILTLLSLWDRHKTRISSCAGVQAVCEPTFVAFAHLMSDQGKHRTHHLSVAAILKSLSSRRFAMADPTLHSNVRSFFAECHKTIPKLVSRILGLDTGTPHSSRAFAVLVTGFKALRIVVDGRPDDAERLVYRLMCRIAHSASADVLFAPPVFMLTT